MYIYLLQSQPQAPRAGRQTESNPQAQRPPETSPEDAVCEGHEKHPILTDASPLEEELHALQSDTVAVPGSVAVEHKVQILPITTLPGRQAHMFLLESQEKPLMHTQPTELASPLE